MLSKGRKILKVGEELRLCEKNAISILTIQNKNYPEWLKQTFEPPLILYVKGDIEFDGETSLGMVGARRPSFYGIETARRFSSELSKYGLTIVSGLARGIDTCSHEGALASGGKTVAVLGSGLLNPYPRENRRLFDKIVEQGGSVVSELPLRSLPLGYHFPLRNRIINGLVRGVCVVEAAENSGSLITANYALEEGREIYSVPGMVRSLTSQGTLKLIQEGAKLVRKAEDILEDYYPWITDLESVPGLIK